ncbi:3-hydroxyacyl-CoA dehydrogenase family protein, partial [Paeniglutamicibacter sp. MACA_103]|uniref:3-hydroxyacyl-CoA dehydrogenase family protein n=1 Tax=Paeniglutamicibacter sp. MACA_103 TaxID=3377337 RepID=UPI00389426BB
MQINNILVIGSGAMGSQIGMLAALAGYKTTIQDIAGESLAAAREQLVSRLDNSVAKGRLDRADADEALARLHFTTSLQEGAANADFVIEAATEKLEIKRSIFAALDAAAPAHAILATNSSTLGSSKVASATNRPKQVCNMHFFN